MAVKEILRELKSLGTEQTKKTYERHGVKGDFFGVRYGDMEKIVKRIKKQPELADGLWETGVFEARVIACKIADASTFNKTKLNRWVKEAGECNAHEISDLVSRSELAQELAEKWINAKNEWTRIIGWYVISRLATPENGIERDWFSGLLTRIEKEIDDAPNWTKEALNNALIAIGGRNEAKLRDAALAAAKRIGKVEVDHGDTSCKTPDAIPYIKKIWDRRKAKKKKQPAKKKRA